ncbi:cofilin-related [Holotrichia oblita]|uniref:Cofilin-related n=2 Tax=Holotrichia oblita TaxID=644536 RepID=A0ACB9TSR4_HOLOL|nr:cofilin-related [Holotrichia oblita]KAI4469833.1 cofilin-related [Holotrichia oblita]
MTSKLPASISRACTITYEEIKNDQKHRYVIFVLNDGNHIDVKIVGQRNENYDKFLIDLEADDKCRYGLYDFDYEHQQKLVLINWCPDTDTAANRMLYCNCFVALKTLFVKGVHKCIEALCPSDITEEAVKKHLGAT